jgi:recombination protein RecA
MFGSPETTSGGNALKFYASVRLDVRRIGAIKEGGAEGKDPVVIGNRTRVKVVKNKMAAPFREVEFDILYGQGVSRSGEVIDMAADAGLVQKSGAWFSIDGERIGQGRDNARTYLEQHAGMIEKLEQRVLAHHGVRRVGDPPLPAEVKADQAAKGKAEAGPEVAAKPAVNGANAAGAPPRRPPGARPS